MKTIYFHLGLICVCGFLWSGCGRNTSAAKSATATALSAPLPVTATGIED